MSAEFPNCPRCGGAWEVVDDAGAFDYCGCGFRIWDNGDCELISKGRSLAWLDGECMLWVPSQGYQSLGHLPFDVSDEKLERLGFYS